MLIYDLTLKDDQLLMYDSYVFHAKGCVLDIMDVASRAIVNGKDLCSRMSEVRLEHYLCDLSLEKEVVFEVHDALITDLSG